MKRFWTVRAVSVLVVVTALAAGLAACATAGDGASGPGSDAELVALVRDRLGQDALTRQNTFSVTSSDGVVSVRGLVRNEAERARVMGVVRGTPGVTSVLDHLQRY